VDISEGRGAVGARDIGRIHRARLGLRDRVGQQRGGRRRVGPSPRVGLQQRVDDRAERARRRRPRSGLGEHTRGDDLRTAGPRERAAALHGRVQGRAEGPQVRRRGRGLAANPLGRGETGRPEHHPGLRQAGVVVEGGNAEVGQHGPVVGAEQHICGLDVPVQDSGGVGAGERAQQVPSDLGRLQRRQRAVLDDQAVERPGGHELHHDPGAAVLLDHVEHRDQVRVVEPCRSLGLAERPLVDGLVLGAVASPAARTSLMATSRSRSSSLPRQTIPMAPRPIGSSNR
jgi:hypothetical protein